MSTRYKVALLLTTFFVIFLVKPTSIHADELDHPPVVTSLTGPTTGYYGQTYNFTVTGTSADGYTITTLYLQNDGDTFSSKSAGDSGCTGTDCSFTGSFTPPTTGTFIIHAASAYTNGVNSDTCNTYSGDAVIDCQNSGDEYITLTILAAPTSPIVQSITGPTTGTVGNTYSFSSTIISLTGLEITHGYISENTSLSSMTSVTDLVEGEVGVDDNCTAYSCSLLAHFTPTVAGTYYIFSSATYSGTECFTHPATSSMCSHSTGRYITFVVTSTGGQGGADEDLPDTGILSTQTKNIFIGLGFISLGILTTQTTRILDILGISNEKILTKKKTKFEKKF
jgi:hypothetical protein